jgi:hypothetical protein
MKSFSILTLAAAAVFSFTAACSSDKSPVSATVAPATEAAHAGTHTYSCSMHPEVVSEQPGSCPKCGMTLEHTDGAASNGKAYRMAFTPPATPLMAGQPATLSFQPQQADDEKAPVPLATVHEKKIHLIIVSRDLSQFHHEHPEFKASGRYDVPFTFPAGGDYVMFPGLPARG